MGRPHAQPGLPRERACRLGARCAPTPGRADDARPENTADVLALSWREMQAVAAKLIAEIPVRDAEDPTIENATPIIGNGDGSSQ
jgi:hypothetical protein